MLSPTLVPSLALDTAALVMSWESVRIIVM